MENALKLKLYAFTLDCIEPHELAKFYAALLRWDMGFADEEYAWVYPPGTQQGETPCLLFQRNPAYRPPVWPDEPEAQQQMAHVDVAVNDLGEAVAHATQCGGTLAGKQFSDGWRVMFDPEGHPFCLCLLKHVFPADE